MLSPAYKSILSNPDLPTLPAVAHQVLELTARRDVDLSEIEQAIERDQAMAAKVLRTVNSSYYGLNKRCGNIRQAVAYLGLDTVKSIVLGFSLVRVTNGSDPDEVTFDFIDYWRRSFLCASVAREIAKLVEDVEPETAFLGALFQDVGMVALWRVYGDRYLQVVDMTKGDHTEINHLERRNFDVDHAEVGAEMTRSWRFPDAIVAAVEAHHHPLSNMASTDKAALVVRLAGIAAQVLETEGDNTKALVKRVQRQATNWFQLDPDQMQRVLKEASIGSQEIAASLDINVGELPSIDDLLSRAEQMRSELPEVRPFENESDAIDNDPTTGFPQRSQLLTDLETFYASSGGHTSLSLLLLGLDEVRALNERLGDQGGDAALEHVADCVREVLGFCRGRVNAYRFVGAEIAVTLEGVTEMGAQAVAEDLRATIACRPAQIKSRMGESELSSVHVTVGVGVHDPRSRTLVTSSPDGLLRAAMCAMTAGRRLGGDRVQVYEENNTEQASRPNVA